MILLTDEAIHKHYLHIKDSFIPRYLDTGRETARAQIKKVYEWGNEDCPHAGYVLDNPLLHKHDCYECWRALLKEVEGEAD